MCGCCGPRWRTLSSPHGSSAAMMMMTSMCIVGPWSSTPVQACITMHWCLQAPLCGDRGGRPSVHQHIRFQRHARMIEKQTVSVCSFVSSTIEPRDTARPCTACLRCDSVTISRSLRPIKFVKGERRWHRPGRLVVSTELCCSSNLGVHPSHQ